MVRILAVDYGRQDLLALGSPLVSALRGWGYEVIEAEHRLDALAKASSARPDAVILYDTLPEAEALRAALHQHVHHQGTPVLLLHEKVQHMRFTDMIVVDPQYRLGQSPRQFDLDELQRLLQEAFPAQHPASGPGVSGRPA